MRSLPWLLLPLLVFVACGEKPESLPPPNILWITSEDTGPAWGCYGDAYATTPNIDQLAAEGGTVFRRAYSNAPICAPARSTLITGQYATSLGTQHLRSDIPVPADLQILPELLRQAGYFTTNNAKTDYNFSPEGRWDENSREAHWRNRAEGQPFFSVFNFGITHEGHTNRFDPEDTESLNRRHDPAGAQLPPYFPPTAQFKRIWAHMNDLMTVFDQEVGKLVAQLKEDGEYDNTIIFVFSDHGYGLPRYKRWLYQTGLQVPFVLHVPEKYRDWVGVEAGETEQMVGFVDFAPSVLQLAGQKAPARMEGKPFLGAETQEKAYIYGYRSRADDCYDVARSVFDGHYLYVRHFMPHKPYIQNALIFNRGKASFEELFRVKAAGELSAEAAQMFARKPVEELYDLREDPQELNNLLAKGPRPIVADELALKLDQWMRKYHDTGLLNEGEMMLRAQAYSSVYEMVRDPKAYDGEALLAAAKLVGTVTSLEQLLPYLDDEDSGVRYWALEAADAWTGDLAPLRERLRERLQDPSPVVAGKAAELLGKHYGELAALNKLKALLLLDEEPVVLQAAINVRELGDKARPLLPAIQEEVMPRYAGEVWGRYKSWLYPMFIGMALDQTQENCGVEEVTGD